MNEWRPISEYSRDKYDWVLVKAIDRDFECIPFVAEMRADGEWYTHGIEYDEKIPFKVVCFFDMQQLKDIGDVLLEMGEHCGNQR